MNSQRSASDRFFCPFQFILKEGKEQFDYSLVMLQINTIETIRSPKPEINLNFHTEEGS